MPSVLNKQKPKPQNLRKTGQTPYGISSFLVSSPIQNLFFIFERVKQDTWCQANTNRGYISRNSFFYLCDTADCGYTRTCGIHRNKKQKQKTHRQMV